MIGKLIFMFIGCLGFSIVLLTIEKIIGVDFGIVPYFIFGVIWGFISDDVLEKLQEHGFLSKPREKTHPSLVGGMNRKKKF